MNASPINSATLLLAVEVMMGYGVGVAMYWLEREGIVGYMNGVKFTNAKKTRRRYLIGGVKPPIAFPRGE